MRAGKRDRRVTIQTATVTQDAHGGQVKSWGNLATVYAEVVPLRGRELIAAAQFMPEAQVKFRMLYRTDFDESARLVHDGVNYEIVHIAEIGRRRGLEILGKRP